VISVGTDSLSTAVSRPILVAGSRFAGGGIALVHVATGGHVLVLELRVPVAARPPIGLSTAGPVALLGPRSLLLVLEAAAGLLGSVHATARGAFGAPPVLSSGKLLGILIVSVRSWTLPIAPAMLVSSGLGSFVPLVATELGLALLVLTDVLLVPMLRSPPSLVLHAVPLAAVVSALIAPFAVRYVGPGVSWPLPTLLGPLSFLSSLHTSLIAVGSPTAPATLWHVTPLTLLSIGTFGSSLALHRILLIAVALGAALCLLTAL
jgi:hypothetical protein